MLGSLLSAKKASEKHTGCQVPFSFDLVEAVVIPRDLVIFVYKLINCLAFSLQVEFVLKLPCLLQMLKEKPLSLSIFVKLEITINIGWKTK